MSGQSAHAVVIGAGHCGLVAAATPADAGWDDLGASGTTGDARENHCAYKDSGLGRELGQSVDIAGTGATAPATAGTRVKKGAPPQRNQSVHIVSYAVLVAPAATTPRDARGLGKNDSDWHNFYDGVLQHLPKRMETNEGPPPRSRRGPPDFWGLTHRGVGSLSRDVGGQVPVPVARFWRWGVLRETALRSTTPGGAEQTEQ